MDSEKLLWATTVSHLTRENRKKSATDGDHGAFVRRNDVAWLDYDKDDGQRKTAVGNWRQSPEARKAEKIE